MLFFEEERLWAFFHTGSAHPPESVLKVIAPLRTFYYVSENVHSRHLGEYTLGGCPLEPVSPLEDQVERH